MPDAPGRVVFVGNIPYGVTEEALIDVLSRTGRVLSFRLVYDKDTARPKGFGFAEFSDPDSAASAVRNLDNYEMQGRKLRVDWSNEGNTGGASSSSITTNNNNISAHNGPVPILAQNASTTTIAAAAADSTNALLPPLPPGTDLPAGLTAPEAISRTLGTLPPQQLLDITAQMKTQVLQDPLRATQLLQSSPQLSYAIFQALLLLGLVDNAVLQRVVEEAATGAAAAGAGIGGGVPTPTPQQQQQQQQQAPLPPPPPPGQPSRDDLIRQVLAMTPQQVEALPQVERDQIQALRMQFGGL